MRNCPRYGFTAFAAPALQKGVDIKTVSDMPGHFSAGFNLDTYAHVTTSAQKAAANTISRILQGQKPTASPAQRVAVGKEAQ